LNDIIVVSRPDSNGVSKIDKSIMSVACGSAHILALTDNFKLFSWGVGSYGALGFGNTR
jgi:alpha-tubulin suppressor-like RCC1 family protein